MRQTSRMTALEAVRTEGWLGLGRVWFREMPIELREAYWEEMEVRLVPYGEDPRLKRRYLVPTPFIEGLMDYFQVVRSRRSSSILYWPRDSAFYPDDPLEPLKAFFTFQVPGLKEHSILAFAGADGQLEEFQETGLLPITKVLHGLRTREGADRPGLRLDVLNPSTRVGWVFIARHLGLELDLILIDIAVACRHAMSIRPGRNWADLSLSLSIPLDKLREAWDYTLEKRNEINLELGSEER